MIIWTYVGKSEENVGSLIKCRFHKNSNNYNPSSSIGCSNGGLGRNRMNVCFRHGLYRQLGNTNKEVSISKKGIEDLLKEQYDTREVSNYDKTDEILP